MPAQTSPGLAMGMPKTPPLSHFARLLAAFGLPPAAYGLGKAIYDEVEGGSAPSPDAHDLTLAGYDWTIAPLPPPLHGPAAIAVTLAAILVAVAVAFGVCVALERLSLDVRGEDPRLRLYEWGLIGIWTCFVVPAALQPSAQWLMAGGLGG